MRRTISNADFIRIWQRAASLEEVHNQSGLAYTSCSRKANILRGKGVPLKQFAGLSVDSDDNDYAALAKLAEQYAPKEDGQ